MATRLAWTARDVFKLSPKEWLIYNGWITFYRLTGLWRYPIPASGDFETMTRADIIYWLYKSQYPVRKAVKGSGLESFFEKQKHFQWSLPPGFRPESEIRMTSVGDLMDHPFLPDSADHLYESVSDLIFGADISTANLECVVFPEGSGSFTIRTTEAPPLYYKRENFDTAKGHRGRKYSFLATACNHSLDCGETGVASTIRALRSEGISFHGVNESEKDADSATIIEKKGIKVALLSHTFGLNAKKPPKDKPWIVNRTHLNGKLDEVDFSRFERQIRYCRENKADLVIAQLHWGMEHEHYPRPDQLEVAHHLAELGCDVVIGHHPHVIQPLECYHTKRDPDRFVPIYYSLGNLINPFSHPEFRRGGVARISLVKGIAQDGSTRTYVKHADMIEVLQEIDDNLGKIRLVPGGNHVRS